MPLHTQQSALVPGFHQLVDQAGRGGERHCQPSLAGGQTQAQGDVGLAGTAVANGYDILALFHEFAPGQLYDQGLIHRGNRREVEGVQALGYGEPCRTDAPLDHPVVPIVEFHFGEAEEVFRVADAVIGTLCCQLSVLSGEGGQPQLLQMVFQQNCMSVLHGLLPGRRLR